MQGKIAHVAVVVVGQSFVEPKLQTNSFPAKTRLMKYITMIYHIY